MDTLHFSTKKHMRLRCFRQNFVTALFSPELCDVELKIDGESVGVWRIWPHQTITLERPVNIAQKFTCLGAWSKEAKEAGAAIDQQSGLVEATFIPALLSPSIIRPMGAGGQTLNEFYPTCTSGAPAMAGAAPADTAAITALGEASRQTFGHARAIPLDHGRTVTRTVRLRARMGQYQAIHKGTDRPPFKP
jgi:hypothetical protein